MRYEIKHRISGNILFSVETGSLKLAAEAAVKSGANLREADLRRADLRGADLDFSTFPFWCGSFRIMADLRLGAQLAYHFCMIDFKDCKEAVEAQKNLKDLANRFHRIKIDCDVLEKLPKESR